MFGDALAAKKPATLRATGHGFPQHMVMAALLNEILHILSTIPHFSAINLCPDKNSLRLH
jgi:hypothetical protein